MALQVQSLVQVSCAPVVEVVVQEIPQGLTPEPVVLVEVDAVEVLIALVLLQLQTPVVVEVVVEVAVALI
jgi:hypothetical protein